MPPKKTESAKKAWDVTFVRCELDKPMKEAVQKYDPKYEATLDGLARLVDDGFKVSISRDSYHDCVSAFLTMPDKQHACNGFCLTARGPNILDVLKVLVYKHYQVLDGQWSTEVDRRDAGSQWG